MRVFQHPDKADYFLRDYVEYKKTKPELRDYFQRYSDDIIVMGGGPSLQEDLKKIYDRKGCIKIACNHHALKFDDCDYLVFLDHIDRDTSKELKEAYYTTKATRITKFTDLTDIYCVNEGIPDKGDTGIFGVWLACYLTRGNVHLCGFDLRKGSTLTDKLFRVWTSQWPIFLRPERINVVSGILQSINPPYVNRQICDYVKHKYRNIAVLGGGPMLENDLKKLPHQDCLLMAVNHHAFKYVNPDLMVFMDDPNDKEDLKGFDCEKVSFYTSEHSDWFALNHAPYEFPTSGHFAAWLASYITTMDIYLCGFGLYDINESINTDQKEGTFWGGPSDGRKEKQWIRTIENCPNQNIQAVSGPLKTIIWNTLG